MGGEENKEGIKISQRGRKEETIYRICNVLITFYQKLKCENLISVL